MGCLTSNKLFDFWFRSGPGHDRDPEFLKGFSKVSGLCECLVQYGMHNYYFFAVARCIRTCMSNSVVMFLGREQLHTDEIVGPNSPECHDGQSGLLEAAYTRFEEAALGPPVDPPSY